MTPVKVLVPFADGEGFSGAHPHAPAGGAVCAMWRVAVILIKRKRERRLQWNWSVHKFLTETANSRGLAEGGSCQCALAGISF